MNESPPLSPGEERITGVVDKVSFFSESSGFTVLRLKIKEDRDLGEDDIIRLEDRYGRQ